MFHPFRAFGLVLFVLVSASACNQCPDSQHGVREGDVLQTTIVAPYPQPFAGNPVGQVSCAELGDLAAGEQFEGIVHLTSSGDTCEDTVELHPTRLNAAKAFFRSGSGVQVIFHNKCKGLWSVGFLGSGNYSLLATQDAEAPDWILVRSFEPSVAVEGCPTKRCADAFPASNVRR